MEKKIINFSQSGIKGTMYYIEPDNINYHFGYKLFIPENCKNNTTLLVHACNTGKSFARLKEANKDAIENSLNDELALLLSHDLNMPVLSPCIPRLIDYNTHFFTNTVYENDLSKINNRKEEKLTDDEIKEIKSELKNIPNQLVNIIKSSKYFLKNLGITIDDKIIMEGYSAGSKFVSGFCTIHPEMIKACIVGGTGGLETLPISEYDGEKLNYPLGTANVNNFNFDKYKDIFQFHYIGSEDNNDPASIVTDESGVITPKYSDTYDTSEILKINKIKGNENLKRYNFTKKIFNQMGLYNSEFHQYDGDHKTIFSIKDADGKSIVEKDIVGFVNKVMQNERKKRIDDLKNLKQDIVNSSNIDKNDIHKQYGFTNILTGSLLIFLVGIIIFIMLFNK